ncbi:MAG: hypothetical protein IKX51_09430 [Bacteroidales bacterium]|nr:hypothetical protein [Bacteroidales bacterium]
MEEERDEIEFEINAGEKEDNGSEETTVTDDAPVVPEKKHRTRFMDVFAGRVFGKETLAKQLPLALLILLYSFLLIANRYNIENLTIENKQLQNDIDELRVRQIQNRCDYMNATMLTEVSEKLKSTGIKAGTTPSMKITIKGKTEKK